jgi:BR serine/threonine kinase
MSGTGKVGDYQLGKTLGEGASSRVKIGTHIVTGRQYAVKIIRKAQFNVRPDLERKIRREIAIMRILDHPNILKLIDVLESPENLYLVVELASHGELFDFLRKKLARFETSTAFPIFRSIIYGLDYLHSRGICHRDLKLENILLDEFDRVKIADFGFANWMRHESVNTTCGSPHYAAPEVTSGLPYNGRCADIWSCGVLLFILLARRMPFSHDNVKIVLQQVRSGRYKMPEDFPTPIRDLISRMLMLDVSQRITLKDIKEHPAFTFDIPSLRYHFPSPVPISPMQDPIDPESVDPATLSGLKALGFGSDEAIFAELLSPEHTSAKLFCQVAKIKTLKIEDYPWLVEETVTTPDELFSRSPKELDHTPPPTDDFGCEQRPAVGVSPPEDASIPQRVDWVETRNEPPAEAFLIQNITLCIEDVMGRIQEVLTSAGVQWFHPTPVQIVAGVVQTNFFATIQARITADKTIEIAIAKTSGEDSFMLTLYASIERALKDDG